MKERVELVDAARNAEVDGAVAEVDSETALESGVHLELKGGGLGALGGRVLGRLEGRLEARGERLVEGLGRGDDDLDLAAVGAGELEETADHLFGEAEAAVLGEGLEEVAALGSGTYRVISSLPLLPPIAERTFSRFSVEIVGLVRKVRSLVASAESPLSASWNALSSDSTLVRVFSPFFRAETYAAEAYLPRMSAQKYLPGMPSSWIGGRTAACEA